MKKTETTKMLPYYIAIFILFIICIILTGTAVWYQGRIDRGNAAVVELYNIIDEQDARIAELESKIPKAVKAQYYNFKNGNFLCGTDFEPGTYDVIATSGIGNVNTSDYDFNAIMGVKSEDDFDMAEQKYENIVFEDGVTLTIDGVGIRLKRVE